MGEYGAWALIMGGVLAFFFALAWMARGAGTRRFMGRVWERGALRVTETEALYFVAKVRGTDAAKIREALQQSDRRAHVWMTQDGRGGDPGRALLIDALNEVTWKGSLDDEFEGSVRAWLQSRGVALESLELACSMPWDDETRARHAWWICYVDYEGVGGMLCCDALEFWMDGQGAGLWSLTVKDRGSLTSKQVLSDPDFLLLSIAAHELPAHLLGGPLKDAEQRPFTAFATPPSG